MSHPMHATLYISDDAAARAAHKALRAQPMVLHANILRRVQRDRDTHQTERGFVVQLIDRDGGVSYA